MITPFLMFQGDANDAIAFYCEHLPDTKVVRVDHFDAAGPGLEATSRTVLSLAGQEVMVFDSPVPHDFGFTPAISFFVACRGEAEIRRLSAILSEGGRALMPLGEYGFSRMFAWVEDRYKLSWQLNLE